MTLRRAATQAALALVDPSRAAAVPAGVPQLPPRFQGTAAIQELTRLVLSTAAADLAKPRVGFWGMGARTVRGALPFSSRASTHLHQTLNALNICASGRGREASLSGARGGLLSLRSVAALRRPASAGPLACTPTTSGHQSAPEAFLAGGIGKTVTGAAIVRDESVRKHFDAIVWLPLGQNPMVTKMQNLCHMQCMGTELSAELSSEEKQQALQQAMSGKRVLLCLDDLWEPEHETALNFADVNAGSKVLIRCQPRIRVQLG
jgi:hypothetical protein